MNRVRWQDALTALVGVWLVLMPFVLRYTLRDGARSLAAVCRSTGAGQDCGACVFSLKRLVCGHGSALVPASPEVDVAAS